VERIVDFVLGFGFLQLLMNLLLQMSFNKLPHIFNKYDIAQSELELSDDTDTLEIENYLKTIIIILEVISVQFYICNEPTIQT